MIPHRLKLLAIDDLPDNLTTLRAVLQEALPECTLLTASSGPLGIDLARAEDPDVILLDIVMPGMDGFDVCRRLKAAERLRTIPVIFLTALRTDRESRIKALEVGADAFLSKPMDEQELVAQVRAMARLKMANRLRLMEKEELAALVAEQTQELEHELAERDRAEAEMKNLRTAVEQSANTIVITNPEGLIEYVNPAFEKVSGYTAAEALGQNPRILKSGEQAASFYCNLWETIASGQTWRGEFHNKRKDGSLYWESATISPVLNDRGEIVRFIAVKEDITQKKADEREINNLRQRLSMLEQDEKRRIAASLHDCTVQDIVAMQLNINRAHLMLGDEDCDLREVREILSDCEALAENSANELRSLAYDLHAPWLQHGGLLSGIQEYAHQFSIRTGISVLFDLPPAIPRLQQAHEIALYRVMQECLMNVHRHSGARRAWISISISNNFLHMAIRDDGGSSPASPPANRNGVGILSMHERMDAIGGTLEVSRTDEGLSTAALLPITEENHDNA